MKAKGIVEGQGHEAEIEKRERQGYASKISLDQESNAMVHLSCRSIMYIVEGIATVQRCFGLTG